MDGKRKASSMVVHRQEMVQEQADITWLNRKTDFIRPESGEAARLEKEFIPYLINI